MSLVGRRPHPLRFPLLALLVFLGVGWLMRGPAALSEAGRMRHAWGLVLSGAPPVLWLILAVRRRGAPAASLLLVMALSLFGARLAMDGTLGRNLHAQIWLLAPLALGAAAWLASAELRRLRADLALGLGLPEALRRALAGALPRRIVPWTADELARVVYALLGPWRRPHESAERFSHHVESGYAIFPVAMGLLLVCEGLPVHLVLIARHPRIAWSLTALSAYALVWVIGDFQALRLRRTVIGADALELAMGLRWNGHVPLASIARAVALPGEAAREPGALAALMRRQAPTVRLELDRAQEFDASFGVHVRADRVLLAPDQTPRFLARLAAAGIAVERGPDRGV